MLIHPNLHGLLLVVVAGDIVHYANLGLELGRFRDVPCE